MLAEATRLAGRAHVGNVTWRHLRAEDLPAGLPPVRVVTFAQSFHWMDRSRVAAAVRGMLTDDGADDGAVVHVHATTHRGVDTDVDTDVVPAHPQPPREAITALVQCYLGRHRRAGRGVLPSGRPGDEDAVYRGAGFTGPQRLEVAGRTVTRTTEEVIASVYSLSSSAPHLFGGRLGAFDAELRALLAGVNAGVDAGGLFSERMRSIALDSWR